MVLAETQAKEMMVELEPEASPGSRRTAWSVCQEVAGAELIRTALWDVEAGVMGSKEQGRSLPPLHLRQVHRLLPFSFPIRRPLLLRLPVLSP